MISILNTRHLLQTVLYLLPERFFVIRNGFIQFYDLQLLLSQIKYNSVILNPQNLSLVFKLIDKLSNMVFLSF